MSVRGVVLLSPSFPIIVWYTDYWVNGIDGFVSCYVVTLLVARKFGIVISGLVAGRLLGDYRVTGINCN